MRFGLRLRLLAATALVAGVALVAMALVSGRVVQNEYRQLVTPVPATGLDGVVSAIESEGAAQGTLAGDDALLERLAPGTGHELVVVDSVGAIVAASRAPLRGGRVVSGPGDRLDIHGRAPGAGALRLQLHGAERRPLRRGDGAMLGTLVVLPPAGAGEDEPPPAFLRSVGRGLVLALLAALALGLALVWLLSGRIVGPIESLTAAARRLAAGDLSPRVEARGGDEVATLARSFNAMADSLAGARTLRRQLTADLAHELRTPLAHLRAQIEALQDGLSAPEPAVLRALHDETLLLARLVDDLQELASAEAGALRLERVALPVAPALESAATAVRARATAAGVTLAIDAGPALAVDADPLRLGQVLRNLLDNALRHTPAGGSVVLRAAREDGAVRVTVEDSGEGLAPEHLPHVFERFWRADPARSRATGGAGLGLAIVQHLVEAHGGSVRAESEPGRGARLSFTLPAAFTSSS